MQGNHPSAPGPYADPHDRGAPHRTPQPGRKAPDAAEQKTNQGRGKDVERKSSFPSQLANPRKLRGIRTFPPPLRLLIYETGHFICYQKRTFLLANDIAGWAAILQQPKKAPFNGSKISRCVLWRR